MRLRLAAIVFLWSAASTAGDDPTFRAAVSLVKGDTSVYNRQSLAPILDLQASDFTVTDEDQPRAIVYFGNESRPVDLLFLLDVSGSVREILPRVANSAVEALAALGEADRSGAMAFSRKTMLTQPLSGDTAATARGILSAASVQIGLDTDINQAVWSAADY